VKFCLLFASALVLAAQDQPATTTVGQPVPFSHKQHAEAAHLRCPDCHKLAPSGEVVSIPTGKACMTCHGQIGKDSPAIQDLKSYVDENQPVPWVRVYELPGFVAFNHKTHLDVRAKCETCHGPVATRDHLWREADLSMGACMNCHRTTRASTNCSTCHNLENY
jgi:Cytochrome c7 and related cytochrome c/Class III cytochrome C family